MRIVKKIKRQARYPVQQNRRFFKMGDDVITKTIGEDGGKNWHVLIYFFLVLPPFFL